MELPNILEDLNKIAREVLGNDSIILNMETTAGDIEDWDSLNHVTLIVSIEKHFKIRFTSSEIQLFKNVSEMCECIKAKLD